MKVKVIPWFGGEKSGRARHREFGDDVRILLQHLVDTILVLTHLLRRRSFLRDERAEDDAAVARRQKSLWERA